MNDVLDALDVLFEEEPSTEYKKRETERRKQFFNAIGKQDDARLCPILTRDEYKAFAKSRHETDNPAPREATLVEVFYEQAAYCDYSYRYCIENGLIYVSSFYVGD